MSTPANLFDSRCPSREFLRVLGDRWTLIVVALLERGTQRNSDLLRQIDGISPKVLSTTLRRLEEYGLIARTVYAEIPPRVEYALTPLGQSLSAVIVAFDQWVETHTSDLQSAQAAFQAHHGPRNPWQDPVIVQAMARPTGSARST